MIVTMCTALFIVHAGDPLPAKELAVIYLTIFVLLFFSGPGRFSIDEMLRRIMA
jgi:putative oxidoreductase